MHKVHVSDRGWLVTVLWNVLFKMPRVYHPITPMSSIVAWRVSTLPIVQIQHVDTIYQDIPSNREGRYAMVVSDTTFLCDLDSRRVHPTWMSFLSRLQQSARRNRLFYIGIPFLGLTALVTFGFSIMTQVRYDLQAKRISAVSWHLLVTLLHTFVQEFGDSAWK